MFKNHLKDNITKDDMSNKFFWDNIVAEVWNNCCEKFILSRRNEISKVYNFKALTYFSF